MPLYQDENGLLYWAKKAVNPSHKSIGGKPAPDKVVITEVQEELPEPEETLEQKPKKRRGRKKKKDVLQN